MRPHLPPVVLSSVAVVLLGSALSASPAVAAQTHPGVTYSWVGSSIDPDADGHSWTDRRNWSPKGVPGDGDVVNIVSPQSGPCDIHVDQVPTGVELTNFLLSTSTTPGCKASISGGSIIMNGGFVWTGGTIDTPITLAPGTGALIGDESVHVVERLLQPIIVNDASLHLNQAHVRLLQGGSVSADADSFLQVGQSSEITGGAALPRLVNAGKMDIFSSTLALDSVGFVQRGELDLDAHSTVVMTHGSLRSHDGARYVGPGRLKMSNGTSASISREQLLSNGVHLELGTDGTEGATLDGTGTLRGKGTVDWTGGTIAALLNFDPGVTLHAYGASTGPGRRILDGKSPRRDAPWHYLVCNGRVVVEDGAGFTMTRHAMLGIGPAGSLALAPGTRIRGTSSGTGDTIRSDAVVSVPADLDHAGPVVLDHVGYILEGGGTDIAPGSELNVSGNIRGGLAQTGLTGGGTFSVASPMDMVSLFTFEDGSVMRLQPGGALDESAVYTGDGSFEWLGGELSGNDVGFALNDMTVGGSSTKSIRDDDGQTSFVQVVNPVTFTPGTRAQPNLLDMNGNSFQSFQACTVQRNVELRDGDFVSSDGAIVFAAGDAGTIVSDTDVQLFSSGPLTVASGTLVSEGAMLLNAGAADIRADATVRLADPSHPLMLQGGSLTGVGTVDGNIVNSGGVFDPWESGAQRPLVVHGSYTQGSGGQLVLDIAADSAPLAFDGAVSVAGIVTYNNLTGYSPGFGDRRTLLTADTTVDWSPGCEETTGTRADRGHWVGAANGPDLLATFVRHPSGGC